MQQIAEVLAAKEMIRLDSKRAFASAAKVLLVDSEHVEQGLKNQLAGVALPANQPTEEQKVPSAFISYSSQDSKFAERLATDLKKRELGVWFDRWEIRVGDSLTEKIGRGIRENDYLIVVLSPHSVASEWVRKELSEAMQREIKEKRVVVLPVLLKSCELPAFLPDKKYADFRRSYEEGLAELVRGIKR